MRRKNSDPNPLLAQAEPSHFRSHAKLRGLLVLAAEELPDAPLYYNLHDVAKTIRTTAPSADTFRSALVNAGALPAFCYKGGA